MFQRERRGLVVVVVGNIYVSPIPVAVQSKARMVLDHSNTAIVGSNPARDMDVCPRFFFCAALCNEEALRWADPPHHEVLPICINEFIASEFNSE
jgi:hypothetical protein